MELDPLEVIEGQARAWGKEHHPDASPLHHAAFINSVTYAVFRFTGRWGGPSVREHTAIAAINESDVADWSQRPREELYAFLARVIYGPITDLHTRTWVMLRDICFDDDPSDVQMLNEKSREFSMAVGGRYDTTRIWPQSLRKLRIIAAQRGESLVECIDRLANEEFARMRLDRGTA